MCQGSSLTPRVTPTRGWSRKTTSCRRQEGQRSILCRRCGSLHHSPMQRGGGHRMKEVAVRTSATGSTVSYFMPPGGPSRRFRHRDEGQQRAGEVGQRPTSVLASALRVMLLAVTLAVVALVVGSRAQTGYR